MIVTVELEDRSYDVVVELDARHLLAELIQQRAPRAQQVAVVTSSALVDAPWFDLESGRDQEVLCVPDGESAKTLESLGELLESLAALRLSRDDVVVAVGGGAVTDVVGFAAATYRRGVGLIHVPSSLVAQVDAAIGGKTGVNLSAGKNLAGAFYQPLGVLCDTGVLSTLPDRERASGMGEIAKCWLLRSGRVDELETTPLTSLIELAVTLKATVVGDDERESGARALLNYGHTLAHALEKLAMSRHPEDLRHGEAVAVGLAFAVRLARELGLVDDAEVANHDAVLDLLGLNTRLPAHFDTDDVLDAMTHDKKAHHDLSFVLPGPAGFTLVAGVDEATVRRVLDAFKETS